MNRYELIDCMLDADKRLQESYSESKANNTVKVFALEGLASGLSSIAMELGFIRGSNEQTNTKD